MCHRSPSSLVMKAEKPTRKNTVTPVTLCSRMPRMKDLNKRLLIIKKHINMYMAAILNNKSEDFFS